MELQSEIRSFEDKVTGEKRRLAMERKLSSCVKRLRTERENINRTKRNITKLDDTLLEDQNR